MKQFLDDDFLLQSKTAQRLYHDYAKELPVIDYHNHLSPQLMAEDVCFENITQAWLYGDHYKWRAMRTNGVDESYCTGTKTDFEKFEQWAATVPYTLRNPLYHWTHLELQRYFNIQELLSPATAKSIYAQSSALLQTRSFSVLNLLRKMKVEMLCTTDDPTDDLQSHKIIQANCSDIKITPGFRPDKALQTADTSAFNTYIDKLEVVTDININSYDSYCNALQQRHDFFATMGCTIADNGLEQMDYARCTYEEACNYFDLIRVGKTLQPIEQKQLKTALLTELSKMHYAKGWVQQFHIGAIRNNNTRRMLQLGPDTGWDSIGNSINANACAAFLDNLDADDVLAKTIIYNLNPADNAMMATMIGNFNDGGSAGKIQWGSSWWFLDQKEGMTEQINTLSNMGLLSKFVGMLTDSRSFLSYPRHEYFRRVLCNLLGTEIENGELPNDMAWTGKIVQDICYYNAKQYFDV
ncbi:glucuronate isomerase [Limnovirga soli]|uniref:Uronate isomerase n=1 Tax=Limnovirga soli TaxID=2656915 RepID=A0A8J8FJK6_9BACT|nr:glucuronate isomerase [Limnovirga soli]NNV56244.1 glucuronate isomerase [Limnovirga soli]